MIRFALVLATLPLAASAHAQPSAESATRAALARIKATNPRINAVIAIDPTALDQARSLDRMRRVRGPLFGVPVLLKDNIDAAPLPTTAGSLALAANVPAKDAPLVTGLRAAGAVILGKTNLSEWANYRSTHSISGWSGVGGQTRNPFALDRSPCGSSAGSGAAVAAGMVDAAIGTETDGSITCPSSTNGIVGLKPTVGLVSRTGIVPLSASQDTAGPMAADVSTAALLLGAIAGSDPADPATREADAHRTDYAAALNGNALRGIRIGVARFSGQGDPAVKALFDRALSVLRAQGAVLVEIGKSGIDEDAIGNREQTVLVNEFKDDVAAYLRGAPPAVKARNVGDLIAFDRAHAGRELGLFGQELFEQAAAARGTADPAYRKARDEARAMARGGIDKLLAANHVAALVFPTAPPAFKIDAVLGDNFPGGYAMGNVAAVAGYPHLTQPMGTVRGMPVGLSWVGTAWSEAKLLGYGYAFERAAPPRPRPTFAPSIEATPEVRTLFAPAGR